MSHYLRRARKAFFTETTKKEDGKENEEEKRRRDDMWAQSLSHKHLFIVEDRKKEKLSSFFYDSHSAREEK